MLICQRKRIQNHLPFVRGRQRISCSVRFIQCIILVDPGAVSRVGRKGVTKVFKCGRKSPWVPTLTELFPNIQADAGSWLGTKKCFVLLCPIGEQFLLCSFREFVRDGYYFDHGLSGSCTKEMHAVRKLSGLYKIPIWFQNTVCLKTKDAFPKIQAWAYNRYSRLHRSRLP